MAGGRPKKEFNQETFEELCSLQCTKEEICSVLKCDEKTLTRMCEDTYGLSFSDAFKTYSAGGKTSLRRAQYKSALSGNATLLVWLGKQYLGQKDIITVGNNDEIEDDPLTKAIKKSMAKNQIKDDNT